MRRLALPFALVALLGLAYKADIGDLRESPAVDVAELVAREFAGDILIAGTEVVNNAILHGNRSQPELKVHILVRHSPGLVEIRVDDEGKGFDLDSRPDPTSPTHLLDESGRGLLIIQHLMDEVRFEQGPAGQTAILIKRLG